jgi:hypothetical protein
MNFAIDEDGILINATTISSTTTLPQGAEYEEDILIDNPGPYDVRVKAGKAGVAASTTLSMRIAAGEKGVYRKGSATHLAVVSINGNQAITVFSGSGS